MVTHVHMRIGRVVAGELKARNLRLYSRAFLFGSVFPDFVPHVPGHSKHQSQKLFDRLHGVLLRRQRSRLKKRVSLVNSFLMGVLSHYAADYACTAHQMQYTDNMRRHMRYEREMGRYLKRNPHVLCRSFSQPVPKTGAVPLSGQLEYHCCDNFADELAYAADAVRLVCASAVTI